MQISISLFLLWVFLPTAYSQQATGRLGHLPPREQQANSLFRELVMSHPEQAVSKQLFGWITNRVVALSYQSDQLPPEMAAELVLIGGKYVPVIAINPEFMLRLGNFNRIEDKKYKQLVLFHEFTHIANHFSGIAPMATNTFDPTTAAERARNTWHSEWLAVKAEWELAKKMNVRHLMSTVQQEIEKYGEQRGLLEAFYKMLTASGSGISIKGSHLLRPTWEKLYLQAKEELRRK